MHILPPGSQSDPPLLPPDLGDILHHQEEGEERGEEEKQEEKKRKRKRRRRQGRETGEGGEEEICISNYQCLPSLTGRGLFFPAPLK